MLHRLGDISGDVCCRSVCGSLAAAPHSVYVGYFEILKVAVLKYTVSMTQTPSPV